MTRNHPNQLKLSIRPRSGVDSGQWDWRIMSRMATKAGLVGKFSNHSLRRILVIGLLRAGVAPVIIAQLSGHKKHGSLLNYATASVTQQEAMSTVL